MTLAKASGALGLVAIALAASPLAHAAEPGWYGGVNVGQSRAKIDDERIKRSLLGSGFATTNMDEDESSTGAKIFGGYQFNRYLALEGGYFSLGKFGYTATTLPAGTLSGDIKVQGLNLDVVGILPLTDKLSAFARAGVTHAQARDNFSSTGLVNRPSSSPSKRDTNYKFGVGVQYAVTDRLELRGEVERYRINDAIGNKGDIDLASVGLVYRFGVQGQRPVARVEAPAPVMAAAPAPLPVPAAPPPPPSAPLMKVAFSADSLFDFNKSAVKPSGKQALDKFSTDLRGTKYDVVKVTGHTDRIGKHDYNMKLSSRRAEAVKSYLSTSAGIPADRITATGVNGADPVTKPGECVGQKPTPKLIACLQPDRRVEVEVSATR
ncbi:MAG: outer membrane beta-barrel protein [Noviherbaspirillum sp.]